MYRFLIYILFLIVSTFPLTGASQSISVTEITPESPARLDFGDQVNISFKYNTEDLEGVRIFVRPISNGNLTPNYSASGSPVYRGKGTGSAGFTIEEGQATVNQLRFRVMSTNSDRRIFQFFVPVEFSFSSSTSFPQLPTPQPQTPTPQTRINPLDSNIDVSEEDTTDVPRFGHIPDSVSVKQRVIERDGTIRIYYTNGYERVVEPGPSGYEYFLTPEDDTLRQWVLTIDVQEASPPQFITTGTQANEEWISSLNDWLRYHNARLMERIRTILGGDEESIKKYKAIEQNKADTIYEEIDLRYRFLKGLMGSDI